MVHVGEEELSLIDECFCGVEGCVAVDGEISLDVLEEEGLVITGGGGFRFN